jgi:hypothetical protein
MLAVDSKDAWFWPDFGGVRKKSVNLCLQIPVVAICG